MKILVAIDSFKGCIGSLEAGNAVKNGISSLCEDVEVIAIADGGEGSVDAMVDTLNAKFDEVKTFDPLFRDINVKYAYKDDLAILEMASSSGLSLLKDDEKNPNLTSTYGLGLVIKDAILKGKRKFIVGIGGSATNDAGVGMLNALGYEFLDKDGKFLTPIGQNLIHITEILDKNVLKELKKCEFKIACDVNNPLFGINGAAYIYGPQKGADENIVKSLDLGLRNFAKVVTKFSGEDNSNLQGSGAAGGLGFAFVSFLNSELLRGFDIISKTIKLEEKIQNADIIITGEGCIDYQSMMGKTVSEIAKLAKKYSKKIIALGGAVSQNTQDLNEYVDAYFCILNKPMSLKEAMDKEMTKANLALTAKQVLRILL